MLTQDCVTPRVLAGDGSHMGLWCSVVIHVVALALTVSANMIFFFNTGDKASDLLMGCANTA